MTRKLNKIAETIVTEDKNTDLYESLNKFYQNDTLNMAEYPVKRIVWRFNVPTMLPKVICLEKLAPALKEQIKTYMRNELIRHEDDWSDVCDIIWGIDYAVPYLEKLQKEDILLCSDKELWCNYTEYLHNKQRGTLRIEISSFLRKLKRFTKCLQQMQYNA